MLKYEWAPTYEALSRFAKTTDGSPFDGVHDEVREPGHRRPRDADDRGCDADAAAGRAHQGAPPHRQLHLPVLQRAAATRSSAVERFDWGERDIFCVPSWTWHEHANASDSDDACLFSFNDLPVIEGLGLYREEALGDNEGYQRVG